MHGEGASTALPGWCSKNILKQQQTWYRLFLQVQFFPKKYTSASP